MQDEPTQDESQEQAVSTPIYNRHLRYPNAYITLLFLSAMDVVLTWTILGLGGSEVNPIADGVIDLWGLNGMIGYKFVLITAFIAMCESVGSLREAAGKSLARISLLIASVPVVWSLLLLAKFIANSAQ